MSRSITGEVVATAEIIAELKPAVQFTVEVMGSGPRGPIGPPGPQGPAGPPAASYTHTQLQAAAQWHVQHVQHGLNRYPSVSIVDSGGSLVIGNIAYISRNEIVLTFTSEFSGKVYLN